MFSKKSTRQTLLALLTAAMLLTSCTAGATTVPTQDINTLSTAIVETTIAQFAVQFTETALAAPTNTVPPTVALPTFAIASPTLEGALVLASPTIDPVLLTPATVSFANTPIVGATQTTVVLPTSQGLATATLDPCNKLAFEGDITVPDGETIKPGTNFQKIWAVRNTGDCTWDDGYTLVYIAGSKPDLDPYNFEFKKTGDFVAPGQGLNLGLNLTTPCAPGKYEGHWRMRDDHGYYFGTILSVYVTVVDKCK